MRIRRVITYDHDHDREERFWIRIDRDDKVEIVSSVVINSILDINKVDEWVASNCQWDVFYSYSEIETPLPSFPMVSQMKKEQYIFYFECKEDAALFKMRW